MKAPGNQVTIIALTATPPYDSSPAEWKRYSDLCGEIDDEIQVPGLVAQKALCRTKTTFILIILLPKSRRKSRALKKKSAQAVSKLINERFLNKALEASGILNNYNSFEEQLYEGYDSYFALFKICNLTGTRLPFRLKFSL